MRVYGSRSRSAPAPLVLHLHGGAFVSGSLECGSTIARLLARAGAVVVSLDYPLAPEKPFPHAAEAVHAALVWAHRHRAKLAGHGARVYVAGEEAGGNLAAAAALMSRDRLEPELAGQILLSPMLDPCLGTASQRDAKVGRAGCKWADGWRRYLCRAGQCATTPTRRPARRCAWPACRPRCWSPRKTTRCATRRKASRAACVTPAWPCTKSCLPAETGWPSSFLAPASVESAWAAALHEPFSQFFDNPASPRTPRSSP